MKNRKLDLYAPYGKQLDFHNKGLTYRERLLMGANQSGKTYCGGAEVAYHMTGLYPNWWEGKVYDRANDWWVGGVTTEAITKGPQNILLGPIGEWGKGALPAKTLDNVTRKQGVPGAAYMVFVKHISGGISQLTYKSYDQGREKWQAATLSGGVWFDEEPPEDIYSEGLTRISATDGITFMTFTPLLGMSNVVRMFYPEPNTASRSITSMTINDVGHYSEEKKKQIIEGYLPHERKARALGLPFMGSGQVFPIDEEEITFDPPDDWKYPSHWPQMVGIDFGWDHPTAAVWLHYDRDDDVVYLSGCYRQNKEGIVTHAAAIRSRGSWIPVAWPHDGLQHDKGSGETLAAQYRAQGVAMLHERAQFADGGHGAEAGIQMLLERMETGRLKIERSCLEFWDEFRQYHRKDGLIVKERDDVLCLHGATLVITDQGKHKISDLVGTSGRVLSIGGAYQTYDNCRKTRENSPMVRVALSDGSSVVCTPDHQFLTDNGWVDAIDLAGMNCYSSVSRSRYGDLWKSNISRKQKRVLMGLFTRNLETILEKENRFSIAMSGFTTMAQSLKNTISTISMVILPTTTFAILSLCWAANIYPITSGGMDAIHIGYMNHRNGGVKAKKEKVFFQSQERKMLIFYMKRSNFFVSNALRNSYHKQTVVTNSAPMPANQLGAGKAVWIMLKEFVSNAMQTLQQIGMKRLKPVVGNVELKCLSVTVAPTADAYCMEVAQTQALAVENGVIVHNCATRYACMMLRYAKTKSTYVAPRRKTASVWGA